MRNLMIVAVLFAVVAGGVGFKQGWLALTTTHRAGSGNLDVHLKFNADKVRADANLLSYIQ
jgi:hypothetical protein